MEAVQKVQSKPIRHPAGITSSVRTRFSFVLDGLCKLALSINHIERVALE